MLEKFLNEYVSIVAGQGSERIVAILFKKKNVNEFLIARKLDMTINQTRNILYKLADKGLVHFMRKKDLKSGGWYTYFWTLDDYKSLTNYRDMLSGEVERQENLLVVRKTKQFYVCDTCGVEVSDEQALLNDFTCSECGEVYSMKDSEEGVKEIEKIVQKMKDKLSHVQAELDKLESSRTAKLAKKVVKKPVKKKKKAGKKKVVKKGKKKTVKKSAKKVVKKPVKKKKKAGKKKDVKKKARKGKKKKTVSKPKLSKSKKNVMRKKTSLKKRKKR